MTLLKDLSYYGALHEWVRLRHMNKKGKKRESIVMSHCNLYFYDGTVAKSASINIYLYLSYLHNIVIIRVIVPCNSYLFIVARACAHIYDKY